MSRTIIERMLAQRVQLRLTRDPIRRPRYPLDMVPVVVVVGVGPRSPHALARLRKVQDALLGSPAGWSNLEAWS